MNHYSPGSLIANRYEVASRPLLGGMGIVYLCMDHQTAQPVALKTFHHRYLPNPAARDHFLQEGTTWVTLGKHPHIVQCYGVEHIGDGREIYLVLELVAKPEEYADASLRSWLTPGKPLPLEQALLFALQIARGMQHACTILPGFVHRDLKPENLLVGADTLPGWKVNRLRITDFGLVGLLESHADLSIEATADASSIKLLHHTTRIKDIAGTPQYMAPEQWQGQALYPQTDVFALGCILGEMLCGKTIVLGNSEEELQQNCTTGRLRSLSNDFSERLAAFLSTCLATHPNKRYDSWVSVVMELENLYSELCRQPTPSLIASDELDRAEQVRKGWAYNNLGYSYLDIGNAEGGIGYFERAYIIGQAEAEPELKAGALNHLGNAFADLGVPQRAIEFYENALANSREIGDRDGEATILGNLGLAYADLGDLQRAIQYYEQALVIHRYISNKRGEGAILGNLGIAYKDLGDLSRAIGCYEQALIIYRQIGDQRGEGSTLGNLGVAYDNLGSSQRAIYYYDQQLVSVRETSNRREEGNALSNLGVAYWRLGDAQRAISYFDQSLLIRREIGDRRGEGNDLSNLGVVHKNLGDIQQAIKYYEQAQEIYREIGDISGMAGNSLNMALLFAQQGYPARALPLAQEAVQIYLQIGHGENAHRAQQLIAQIQGGREVKINPGNPIQAAFDAFQRANTCDEMRTATEQYPFMTETDFIKTIEQVIAQQVPPEFKPVFDQRMEWLQRVAGSRKPGLLNRLFGKKK